MNATQEAVRLALVPENEGGTAIDFGIVIVSSSNRLGWKGTIEVDARTPLDPAAFAFLRDRLINEEREPAVNRYRLTRADGSAVEGPFVLETFSSKSNRYELVLSAAGDQTETGERDPIEVARQAEERVIALGDGAAAAVRQVLTSLVENRPDGTDLDDALSAVIGGGLAAIVAVMIAADPDSRIADVEKALLEAVTAVVGSVKQ